MARLGIRESDLEEKFVAGSGPGGQKINKTSSRVSLTHSVSGIEIQCQDGRSQAQNRYFARVRLCERIEGERKKQRQQRDNFKAKVRFWKKGRSPAEKARQLDLKRERSEKKRWRRQVAGND